MMTSDALRISMTPDTITCAEINAANAVPNQAVPNQAVPNQAVPNQAVPNQHPIAYMRHMEGYLPDLSWNDVCVPTVLHGDFIEDTAQYTIVDVPFKEVEDAAYYQVISGARILVDRMHFIQDDGSCILVDYIATSNKRDWEHYIAIYYDGCKSPYRESHIMVDGYPISLM